VRQSAKILSPTIFLGLYGSIDMHPWIDPRTLADVDLYGLVVERATAMGWTWTTLDGPTTVLWGMNDGDQDWTGRSPTARIAWLQVTAPLAETSVYVKRTLPVQPLLSCVHDSVSRVGRLSMTAAQLLLPIQASGSAEAELMTTVNWFRTCDPGGRTRIHVTLDTGEGDGLRPVADDLLRVVQERNTGSFTFRAFSFEESVALDPNPPVATHDAWRGKDRAPVTFEATVPEWSVDAVGWLVTLFADACRHVWVDTSVLITVARVAVEPADAPV